MTTIATNFQTSFSSDYEAMQWVEQTHPGAMERWLLRHDMELGYNIDFDDMLWEVERVIKDLGYVCEITYLGFGDSEWVVYNPLVINATTRIQRWWRRHLHNQKYLELYAQVLGVPANHPSAIGKLLPLGGYGFREIQQEVLALN
jgi:hypothetical protein